MIRLAALAAALALAASAAAQPGGAQVQGQITLGSATFPLPPGTWRVVVNRKGEGLHDAILVREPQSGSAIAGIALLSHNWTGRGLGFPKTRSCERRSVRSYTEKNDEFGDQACWSVAFTDVKALEQYMADSAAGRLLRKHLDATNHTIASEILLSTALIFASLEQKISVQILDDPAGEGHDAIRREGLKDSAWASANIRQHPDKLAYMRARITWSSQSYEALKRGFAALK